MIYSVKCDCGDVVTADAQSRDEAVSKLKEMWGPDAVAQHYADKHPGQPVPSQEQVHANIDQGVQEGDQSAGGAPAGDTQPA